MKPVLLALWLLQGALAVDLSPLETLQTLTLQSTGSVAQISFSPDQRSLATMTGNPAGYLNQEIDLWDIATGQRVWRWSPSASNRTILSLRFRSANVIELRSSDGTNENLLLQLSARTGKQLGQPRPAGPTLEARLIQQLKFTPEKLVMNSLVTASSPLGVSAYSQQTTRITLVDTQSLHKLGQLEEAHGQVMKLEFSPDGQFLAAARADGRISLWDLATRKKRFNLRGHQSWDFRSLEWSNDSKRLLSIAGTEGAILWDVRSGAKITSVQSQIDRIETASFNPSGQSIALGRNGAIFIMQVRDGAITQRIGFMVSKTAFSSDGATLCIASGDGRIRVYQRGLAGYELRDELRERSSIFAMTVTENQRLVFQAGDWIENKPEIGVYNLRTKTLKKFAAADRQGMVNLIFNTDNPNQVLIGELFFDVVTGVYLSGIAHHEISSYRPRPDLNRILYRSDNGKTLTMTAMRSDTKIWERLWLSSEIAPTPQWSPTGALLASDWLQHKIIILDAKTGKTKALISPSFQGSPEDWPAVDVLAFNATETLLFVTYTDRSLRFFDLKTRVELSIPLELRKMKPSVEYLPKFTPDGRALMISTLEGLEFWGVPGKNIFGK
jgi:WD40 repeat protein